ncbi:release factor glutamine methyltransferase [Bacilli bacterium PM5-3]|nr:release factor glutamine methyltransferase [Bacilli bacterium PM5-3]MDH6604089.1 release factor glutamine methyltransferase [Bacilli bacterium PM5-9]
MRIRELLNSTVETLIENNKEERAAYELLKEYLNLESYELYSKLDEMVADEVIVKFKESINEYILGKPLQHILGYETFFGRDMIVNEDVLIPRYETEELVENILYHIDDYFDKYDEIVLADIGTGSGAIALSLDLEETKTKVYATDISEVALKVAKDNCNKFQANVELMQGSMLEPLIEKGIKLDILVSNPPYIPDDEYVEDSVKTNEPNIALFGGEEGLDFYIEIFKNADKVLKEKALLAFEIGYNQKESISKAVNEYFSDCEFEIIKDINGKDRMLFIYKNIKR